VLCPVDPAARSGRGGVRIISELTAINGDMTGFALAREPAVELAE
jgi:hypothetical protein